MHGLGVSLRIRRVVQVAWTPEEDAKLTAAHDKYGNRWSKIVRNVPGTQPSAAATLNSSRDGGFLSVLPGALRRADRGRDPPTLDAAAIANEGTDFDDQGANMKNPAITADLCL
jgi:hypothetical protein